MSSLNDINSKPNSMNNDHMEEDIPSEPGDSIFSPRNVLQPFGLRRAFQNRHGLDRFLLDYYFHFLLRFSILLWVVFLIKKVF